MTLTSPVSLTEIPQNNLYRKGDVFVLFGELFGRGYVTGLLDQANTMMKGWGEDRRAGSWLNRLEDRFTSAGPWSGAARS